MASRKRLAGKDLARVRELSAAGKSQADIAAGLGVARSTFKGWLQSRAAVSNAYLEGKELRRQRLAVVEASKTGDEFLDMAFQVASEGGDVDLIALRLGLHTDEVREMFQRDDVRERWRLGRAQLKLEVVANMRDQARGVGPQSISAAKWLADNDPEWTHESSQRVTSAFQIVPTLSADQFETLLDEAKAAGRVKR